MWNRIAMEIASCGMHRCSKSGVGTWGAFIGLVLQLFFVTVVWWQMVALTSVAVIVGLIVTRPAESLMFERYGPRKRHTGEIVAHDFNQDCFDEVVGQLIAGIPVLILWIDPFSRAIGFFVAFLAFRTFDILKPWPIKRVEKMFCPGSACGIILDDVVAGIYAWPALWLLDLAM